MLSHLIIKNYALIRHLEIAPARELNIITGETGAGKSIMLGAIGLMLGNRADTKVLFDENEKCIIEGTFNIAGYDLKSFFEEADIDYEEECIIRREISANGKSRAFINDTPVNLDVLKKWGSSLVDIHSQHETLLLGNTQFQLSILDAFAGNKNLLGEYKELFKTYKNIQAEYEDITSRAAEEKKQLDYNSYLLHELKEASLEEGEQEKKEEALKVLENAEYIKSRLDAAQTALSGSGEQDLITQLQDVRKQLDQISNLSSTYTQLRDRIQSVLIELKDVAAELENENEQVEHDPRSIEAAQERLSLLYTLQKKHQVQTVGELLLLQQELEQKMAYTLNLDEHIATLKKKMEATYKELYAKGKKLSEARQKAAAPIKKELETLLKEVGMPNASIAVDIKETEPGNLGIDQVALLFSANKGIAPQELKTAASGGEFSRLMLCIKYIIADKTALPTIIFDEIDTGISGEVAIKVGKMMKQMAASHQVISISHLPQIAAQGKAHYYVYKDNSSDKTISKMKLLSEEERVKEIAQMIGGSKPSETAIQSAKELLSV
ncbi:MAG TPA: DNA repair protein RecN [Cytophagaceae bacterium]|nr:DNA repair protein RecN [Cytophagaceae bacterium]